MSDKFKMALMVVADHLGLPLRYDEAEAVADALFDGLDEIDDISWMDYSLLASRAEQAGYDEEHIGWKCAKNLKAQLDGLIDGPYKRYDVKGYLYRGLAEVGADESDVKLVNEHIKEKVPSPHCMMYEMVEMYDTPDAYCRSLGVNNFVLQDAVEAAYRLFGEDELRRMLLECARPFYQHCDTEKKAKSASDYICDAFLAAGIESPAQLMDTFPNCDAMQAKMQFSERREPVLRELYDEEAPTLYENLTDLADKYGTSGHSAAIDSVIQFFEDRDYIAAKILVDWFTSPTDVEDYVRENNPDIGEDTLAFFDDIMSWVWDEYGAWDYGTENEEVAEIIGELKQALKLDLDDLWDAVTQIVKEHS